MLVFRATAALLLMTMLGAVPSPSTPAPEPISDWILSLQVESAGPADGALAIHTDPAFYHDDQPFRHVVPYFSNLALTSLLDAQPSPEALAATERWIEWTLTHIGTRGVPTEHWVSADGTETDCPARLATTPVVDRCQAVDATDSAAATFLDLVRAYTEAGGGMAPEWDGVVRAMGETLSDLQDDDGLTWAKHDYRVKYLMDNAETVQGFRALAILERDVFGDLHASARASLAANRAAGGVLSLRDPVTRLYAWARLDDGTEQAADLDNWYADAVAQVWPLLFDAASRSDARAGYVAFSDHYDGAERPDWTASADPSGFDWPAVGVAALLAGDRDRAARQVRSLWARRVGPGAAVGFAAPFTVADAGWLLRAVVATS